MEAILKNPDYRAFMAWDEDMQMNRVSAEVEVQVYDGGNQLLNGEKWMQKQMDKLPALDY